MIRKSMPSPLLTSPKKSTYNFQFSMDKDAHLYSKNERSTETEALSPIYKDISGNADYNSSTGEP